MDRPALRLERLSKTFGDVLAVDDVSLEVPRGVVFGYLGPNGAGKTTTIRMLLGLLKPSAGSAHVNGFDAWADRERAHRSLGYLPGDFDAYPDLTSAEYLRYLAELRGNVAWSEVEKLAERLELRMDVRFGTLSHGNKQKLGIVQAFMHRPDFLVLDEPTSGLDPLVQQEFLSLVGEARAEGRTVFMSSHVLSEVEAVADMFGMLNEGRLLLVDRVAGLRERALHTIEMTFASPPPVDHLRTIEGVRDLFADGVHLRLTIEGSTVELMEWAAPYGIEKIRSTEPDLEELFLEMYEGHA
jgi:ABC-2 type transport system ATP-binding protein